VEVKLEAAEVHPGDLGQANADELVRDVRDVLMETNNLLVKGGTVASRLAAEDEEDRLAGALGLGPAGLVVGIPTVPGGGGRRPGRRAAGEREKGGQNQDAVHEGDLRRGTRGGRRAAPRDSLALFLLGLLADLELDDGGSVAGRLPVEDDLVPDV